MPFFSTSSLTDMPLVRLSELIMSSRGVRPISEIKRWFIRLKWLEWNESARLYTPRSLIRKPKVYTTVERKRNYKATRCDGPASRAAAGKAMPGTQRFVEFPSERKPTTSRDTRRDTRVAVRTAGSRCQSPGTRRFSLRNSRSRFFHGRDRECNRD